MRQAGDFCMWQNEVERGYFDLTHCNVQERFKYAVHNMTVPSGHHFPTGIVVHNSIGRSTTYIRGIRPT